MVVVTYYAEPGNPFVAWLWYMGLLVAFIVVAGVGITMHPFGFLIDNRNKMSLSRFQIVLWTIVILPALMAVGMARGLGGIPHPLDIHIPQQIWLVLGISTTSLVGSPLLLSQKTRVPAPAALAAVNANGLIAVNGNRDDASWSDLFKGEEVGNYEYMDMAKIQMFFFTLVLVAIYAIALATLLYNNKDTQNFPSFDSSMTALLAISHSGYLASKMVPHTP